MIISHYFGNVYKKTAILLPFSVIILKNKILTTNNTLSKKAFDRLVTFS